MSASRAIRVNLHREWREHRGALGAIAVVLAMLAFFAVQHFDRRALPDEFLLGLSIMVSLVAVQLVVGGELLGRDAVGARRRFLERIPSGDSAAFVSKLLFAALLFSVAIGYGWILGTAATWLRGSEASHDARVLVLMLPALIVGLWTIAVSPWTPRPTLAFPVALVLIGLVALPPVYAIKRLGYRPPSWEVTTALALAVIGALLAARASFVVGRRAGGTALKSAGRGLAFALLFLGPIPAWTGYRIAARNDLDPTSEEFELLKAHAFDDGRHVVLAGTTRGNFSKAPYGVFVVDLEQGTWKRATDLGDEYLHIVPAPDGMMIAVFDEHSVPRCELSSFDGTVLRFRSTGPELWMRAGLGCFTLHEGRTRYFDPSRNAMFELDGSLARLGSSRSIWVRPGRWAVRVTVGRESVWYAYDPEARSLFDLDWPPQRWPATMLADGRMAFVDEGRVLLGDTDTGELSEVTCSREIEGFLWSDPNSPPAESVLVRDGTGFLLLDARTSTLEPLDLPGDVAFVRGFDDGRMLLMRTSPAQILERSADGELRTLFPRRE